MPRIGLSNRRNKEEKKVVRSGNESRDANANIFRRSYNWIHHYFFRAKDHDLHLKLGLNILTFVGTTTFVFGLGHMLHENFESEIEVKLAQEATTRAKDFLPGSPNLPDPTPQA